MLPTVLNKILWEENLLMWPAFVDVVIIMLIGQQLKWATMRLYCYTKVILNLFICRKRKNELIWLFQVSKVYIPFLTKLELMINVINHYSSQTKDARKIFLSVYLQVFNLFWWLNMMYVGGLILMDFTGWIEVLMLLLMIESLADFCRRCPLLSWLLDLRMHTKTHSHAHAHTPRYSTVLTILLPI